MLHQPDSDGVRQHGVRAHLVVVVWGLEGLDTHLYPCAHLHTQHTHTTQPQPQSTQPLTPTLTPHISPTLTPHISLTLTHTHPHLKPSHVRRHSEIGQVAGMP